MKILFTAFAGLLLAAPLTAHAAETGKVTVKNAWLRATPKGAPVAGGYATITNSGAEPDTLVSASIPEAPTGEVHSMTMANGVMHMQKLDKGLAIPPGATVTLKPGGYHLMFMNPSAQLKEGQTIQGTVTFAKAGTLPVSFSVAGMAAKTPPGQPAHDHGHMDGMDHMDHMDMH